MHHKALLTCLGVAMSCGMATVPAQAAGPGSGLIGLHATDGSSLVQKAHYYDYGRRRHWGWWHSRRWDNNNYGWNQWWGHHHRDYGDYGDHRWSRRHGEHRGDRRDY